MKEYSLCATPTAEGSTGAESITEVRTQIENVMQKFSKAGFCYTGQVTAIAKENPGCLAALFGARQIHRLVQFMVFEKDV